MTRKIFFCLSFVLALAAPAPAQNTNSSTTTAAPPATRKRTTTTPAAAGASGAQETPATAPATARKGKAAASHAANDANARAVRDAFDELIAAVRRADAEAVMKLYWNSPQLLLFNNNGTVTKTWEQAHSNRVSLYKDLKDVKLDVRDPRVQMLGPTAAVVTYLWTQSQTAGGNAEKATGRTTLVFQKIGNEWKAVHAHVSPDRPDPSLLLPSERTTEPEPTPAAQPPVNL